MFKENMDTRKAAGDIFLFVLIDHDLAVRLGDGVVGRDFVRENIDLEQGSSRPTLAASWNRSVAPDSALQQCLAFSFDLTLWAARDEIRTFERRRVDYASKHIALVDFCKKRRRYLMNQFH